MQQRSEDNGHSSEALVDLTETQTPLPRLCPGPLSETCSRERDAAARSRWGGSFWCGGAGSAQKLSESESESRSSKASPVKTLQALLCNPGPA